MSLSKAKPCLFSFCVCDGKGQNAEAMTAEGFFGGLLQNAFDLPQAGVAGGAGREGTCGVHVL